MKALKIGIVVIVLAIIAFVALHKVHQAAAADSTPSVAVVDVEPGTTETSVMAEGSIVPVQSVDVSVLPGYIGLVTKVNVNIGDWVHKGEVLAELDSTMQQMKMDSEMAKLKYAEAHLALAENPYRPEQIQAVSDMVEAYKESVVAAQNNLDLVKAGTKPERLAELQDLVDEAQLDYDQDVANNARTKDLFDKNLIPKVEMEDSNTNVAYYLDKLNSDKDKVQLAKNEPLPQEVAIAEASLDHAKARLDAEQQTYKRYLEGSRPEVIEAGAADVADRQALADETSAVEGHHLVVAPIDGVITARNVNEGEVAMSGTPRTNSAAPLSNNAGSLFVIADDSHVQFMASVDQRFYPNVHVGQDAQVGIETLPGQMFRGKIVRVQPLINLIVPRAGSSLMDPSTPLTFYTWVQLDNNDQQFVPGQIGLISLSTKHTGLVIPEAAITPFSMGQGLAYVENDGVIKATQVRYSDNNNGQVQILSGLHSGDHVVVSSILNLHDGMRVNPVATSPDDDDMQKQSQTSS